jgi:hypothetical protein
MRRTLRLAAGLALLAQGAWAQGTVPAETIGQAGGLNFQSGLVAENLSGFAPQHTQQASLAPGRIAVETDPTRIRSGQTSIRMQIQPGDCSARIGGGQPDDCASGNERIEIGSGQGASGIMLEAFSLMLGGDFRNLNDNAPAVNLVQWFQQNAGACFSLQYNAVRENLSIRNRCTNGSYNTAEPQDVELRGNPIDSWQEFVVLANWSKGADGLFRVLVNNDLVYDYRGPTLAAEGADVVSERFMILRQNGLGVHTGAATMWLDDVIRAGSVAELETRYAFERANLGVQ